MVKLYKLTDDKDRTYGRCQWGEGVEHTAPGTGSLCTRGWLHAYSDPLLAVLMNPAHAGFNNPHLWEAEGDVGVDCGDKVGCTRLKTIRRMDLPVLSLNQILRFGILAAKQVCWNSTWRTWADGWLDGRDRSLKAAEAAHEAVWPALAAAQAALGTVLAARGAPLVADAADAAAAERAAQGELSLDLVAIAHQAVAEEG